MAKVQFDTEIKCDVRFELVGADPNVIAHAVEVDNQRLNHCWNFDVLPPKSLSLFAISNNVNALYFWLSPLTKRQWQ